MTNPVTYACRPEKSLGRPYKQPGSSYRSLYQRDHDRIVHARAFRKLQHKTQVFVSHEGDFHRTRLTHSLEVAQITRTVCRALRLNEDPGVTVALAHDLGHPPFGHTGEDALNAVLERHGFAPFDHNFQALRIVHLLESPYPEHPGLNLTWETLDGLAKHNGPVTEPVQAEKLRTLLTGLPYPLDRQPCLEAQIANLCDDIAYNCHDTDDGIRAGLFHPDDLKEIPALEKRIGSFRDRHPKASFEQEVYNLHRVMITEMVNDVIGQTRANLALHAVKTPDDIRNSPPLAAFSDSLLEWLKPLRGFLFRRVYRHGQIKKHRVTMAAVIEALFAAYIADPDAMNADWAALYKTAEKQGQHDAVLIDYLSGMTDRYALEQHKRICG